MKPKNLAKRIAKILSDKKAEDILLIDVRSILSPYAYFFVVATGTSEPHIRSLADEIKEEMGKKSIEVSHIEGYSYGHWVLIDYLDVVVHIFLPEERRYYGLEDLWGDMPMERIE